MFVAVTDRRVLFGKPTFWGRAPRAYWSALAYDRIARIIWVRHGFVTGVAFGMTHGAIVELEAVRGPQTPARGRGHRKANSVPGMTTFGFQIPGFRHAGATDAEMFDNTVALAHAAEASGFSSVWVMDHFWQLPALGGPDEPILEAYTLLGALAARTERVQLGTLVTGVTYRNPALLAKMVTTLDIISHGRAILGIGAAWYDVEHAGYGFDFPVRANASTGSRKPCRSVARCCATSGLRSAVASTRPTTRATFPSPSRSAGRRS